jgi:tetratricopeptide (TPR) repeat protein
MKPFRKILFIIAAGVFSIPLNSLCQRAIPVSQRLKIDSLKKIISTATDSAKADALNQLAFEFCAYNSDTTQHWNWWNPDSARRFAMEAFNLTERIQYSRATGDALSLLGMIATDIDFTTAETYTRQAIPYYEKINDQGKLAMAFTGLGWSLYAQSRFEESRFYEQKALDYFIRVQNKSKISMLYRMIGFNWGMQGYQGKAFECSRMDDSTMATVIVPDAKNAIYSPRVLGSIYEKAGDHSKALIYFQKSAEAEARHYKFPDEIYENLAETFAHLKIYDSAAFYHKLARRAYHTGILDIATVYMDQKRYDLAIPELLEYLQIKKLQHDNNQVMFILENIVNCYQSLNKYDASFPYATSLLNMATQTGARPFKQKGYAFLRNYYDHTGKTDSAYKYFIAYNSMKDSLKDDEFIKSIAVYDIKRKTEQQQSSIALLNKENQLKESRIHAARLSRNVSFVLLAIGLIITLLIVRNSRLAEKKEHMKRLMLEAKEKLEIRENEQLVAKLEHQKTELEMQVLRSQMNPHFIFNSLSSINRFILTNNRQQASEYLTKFSKLMRLILQNSQESMISLESELESLKLYLDLEALRFNYRFGYKISVAPEMDTSVLKVPPLIVQPYVENAIWHGLMHLEGNGQLDIEFSQEDELLFIKVTDDGVGRQQSVLFSSHSATLHKPMGLRITAERIQLLENTYHKKSSVKITDLVHPDGTAAGTEVTLKIPAIYD